MRAGRLIAAALAILLLMIVAGIWAVPGLLDWNQHRSSIESLAGSLLGRPVHIGGDVTLQLLPQPILTASKLEVEDTGDGVVLTARALRLRVALAPLLAGRIDAQDLTIEGADLQLPWPPAPGAMSQRPPAWLTGLQARIEASRITIGAVDLTGVDARFQTDAETGTLSVAGGGHLAANSVRFTGRLTRPGRDGSAGAEISIDGAEALRDTGARFTGQLAGDGALSGRVVARGPDLSLLLPLPAVPWRADGRLTAADGLAVADELALDINGSAARGAVTLRVSSEPRIDVAVAAGRLDLDEWLPILLRAPDVTIPTGLDLSVEAATLGGSIVRRVRGAFDFDHAGVAARELTALLPGDAALSVSGSIPRTPGAAPAFGGTGRLSAPDLRTTLGWAGKFSPTLAALMQGLPQGVLRVADVQGHVSLGGDGGAAMTALSGTLDDNAVNGSVRIKEGGPRPALEVVIETDRLPLDPWLPGLQEWSRAGLTAALMRPAALDIDGKVTAREAVWRGVPIQDLALEVETEAGRLALRHLGAVVLGLHVQASGALEGGRISDGRLDLETSELAPWQAIWPDWPGAPLLRGPGTATALLGGPPDALTAKITGALGDLRIEALPVINLVNPSVTGPLTLRHPGAPRLLNTLGLRGTAAWLGDGSLSAVAQVNTTPERTTLDSLVLTAGQMRAHGQLAWTQALAGSLSFESLPLPLPALRSPDPLPFDLLQGWAGRVNLNAGEVTLDLIPVLHSVSALVGLDHGRLSLSRLQGQIEGGAVSGAGSLTTSNEPPEVTLSGRADGVVLTGSILDAPAEGVDVSSGTLSAHGEVKATGHSMAALLATLTGTASATVREGIAKGFDLAAASESLTVPDRSAAMAQARRALLQTTTPFGQLDLDLTLLRGAGTVEGSLTAPTGTATLRANVDLPAKVQDTRLVLHPAVSQTPIDDPVPTENHSPEIGLRITGPFAMPRRTPELAGLSRWLTLRP